MLKRSLVSALVLLYSVAAIGMPMHFHYCRGELKHITLLLPMECHEGEAPVEHACCMTAKTHCSEGHSMNACCDEQTQWLHEEIPAVCAKTSDLDEVYCSGSAAFLPAFPDLERDDFLVTGIVERSGHFPEARLYIAFCTLIFYG